MAEIQVQEPAEKKFGDFTAVKDVSFTIPGWVILLPARIFGLRQDHHAAHDRRPRTADFRQHLPWRRRRGLQARIRTRHRLCVPALCPLPPHECAKEHRLSPAVPGRSVRQRSRSRVEETAKLLRIDHILDKSVSGLAGGDRQRVALGRAIVRRPLAFLMDEPLGTLDTEFRDLMCEELRHLHDRIKATTVYVTHDQLEAMSMADYIAIMNRGVDRTIGHAAVDL